MLLVLKNAVTCFVAHFVKLPCLRSPFHTDPSYLLLSNELKKKDEKMMMIHALINCGKVEHTRR